jgi:hypothetical protein
LLLALPAACERPAPPQSGGGDTAANQSDTNAVDEYRSLHDAMSEQLLALIANAEQPPSPSLTAALQDAKPIIERLVWATALERCDWGIDYAAGADTELPHLTKLRGLARLLRADAYRALQEGDTHAAAADVAALVNMSTHVGGKAIIEPLVAFGVLKIATDLITEHAGSWTKDDRAVLRAALARIDTADPFGADASLEWDKRMSAQEGLDPPDEARFRQTQEQTRAGLRAALAAVE